MKEIETHLRTLLADVYTPEGVEAWLNAPHRLLGGERPLDVLDTEPERVIQVVYQLVDGTVV
jgi:uncharacterized protein (DUF2384 family)